MKVTVALMCLMPLLMGGQADDFHCASSLDAVVCTEGTAEEQTCTACSTHTEEVACEDVSCVWTAGADECKDLCPALSDQTGCEGNGCVWTENECSDTCNGKDENACTTASECVYDVCETDGGCTAYDHNDDVVCGDLTGCTWGSEVCDGTFDCTLLNADETTCTAVTGCTWNTGNSECDGGTAGDCADFKDPATKCNVDGCTWSTDTCTDECDTYVTESDCTNAATVCKVKDTPCKPIGGTCEGDDAEDCKEENGCLFAASTCANTENPACPGDKDSCGDDAGCVWQSGECSNTVTGTCEDKGNEADCCAEGCTWAECKDDGENGGDSGNMQSMATSTLMLSLISVKILL